MIQLTSLLTLSGNNPLAAECLDWIKRAEDLRYRDDCLIPLAQAIDIYSARARIKEKRGGHVEGYEQLLPALTAASIPMVRLHALEFLSHWFVAFTDESFTRLFGVLKSREQKDAWYDPAKG